VRYSAENAHCEGITPAMIEDACRGIDVEDSVAATRKTFAALDIS
jgi:nicotinamidase/pyrazinamidase